MPYIEYLQTSSTTFFKLKKNQKARDQQNEKELKNGVTPTKFEASQRHLILTWTMPIIQAWQAIPYSVCKPSVVELSGTHMDN